MCDCYPNYKPSNLSETVDVWNMMLEEYDYSQISMALKTYVHSDTSGFAPSMTERLENRHTEILSKNLRAELIQKIYLKNSLKLNVYYWSVIRMSGLISRSEVNDVIDELEVYTSGRPNTMKVEVSVLQLQRFINKLKNIPTAYDVDKIVEQLKTDSLVKLYGSGNSDNYLIPVKRAIEIVRAGGNIELSEHSKSQGDRTGKQKATVEAESKVE
jgi:hypothetical protein